MIIDPVRLPMDIERGVKGGPQFNTSVLMTDGGNTDTNQNWTLPLYRGNVGYGIQTKENLDAVINFFWARRGRLRGFLFRDWSDFKLTAQQIGVGDGIETDFQIVRTYADTVLPFTRTITRPVESGSGFPTLHVSVNGVQLGLSSWSLQPLGVVRITVAPAMGEVITVDGVFDIPVQFATDMLEQEMWLEDVGAIPQIPIVEIREAA
jgi:uncharacterized protein (TIGR02217 family)